MRSFLATQATARPASSTSATSPVAMADMVKRNLAGKVREFVLDAFAAPSTAFAGSCTDCASLIGFARSCLRSEGSSIAADVEA
jgi:hypothetical protein